MESEPNPESQNPTPEVQGGSNLFDDWQEYFNHFIYLFDIFIIEYYVIIYLLHCYVFIFNYVEKLNRDPFTSII